MIRYWGDPKNKTIPPNLLAAYVERIAVSHGRDDRVLMWDLCNEPFNSGTDSQFVEWLNRLYRQCKAVGVKAPLGVSVPPSLKQLELVEPIGDVLMIHRYGDQKFLDGALALGWRTIKPVVATACCWGHLDDARRAAIVEKELTALKAAGIGFLAHVLHHSLGDGFGESWRERRPPSYTKLRDCSMVSKPSRASFRFYAELNDHLAPDQRFRTIEREFLVPASVKDMIESFGVPHTEVELILINGETSDFSRLVRDADRVAVYPVFESLDITPELCIRRHALREPKFVLDVHLGRLAAYLRMLGFDAAYRDCASGPELVRISIEQKRILLTRGRGLLKHSALTHGYWLRETGSRRQAAEVVRRFDLARSLRPFTRCMACNEPLRPATQVETRDRVPARIAARYQEFHECPGCQRVYWQGSHYQRMRHWIEELAAAPRGQ